MKNLLLLIAIIVCSSTAYGQGGAANLKHGTLAERPPCVASRGEVYFQTDGFTGVYDCPDGTWRFIGGGDVSQGLLSARPTASQANRSQFYFATDTNGGTLYVSTGSAWVKVGLGLTETPPAHTHTLSQITDAGTAASKDVAASGDASSTQVVKGNDTRLTNSRTPSGGAGGVLSGSYPNPGFAVDMAEQTELDSEASARASADSTEAASRAAADALKLNTNIPITGATKTKVTYDANGLVTSGTDATTADIADSTDRRYVTDAQRTVIQNTSGNNSGDQDLSGYVPTTRTVNGHALSSNVSVTASDVGLGNVTNTSDANKPVSTAQQAALDLKANLISPVFSGHSAFGGMASVNENINGNPAQQIVQVEETFTALGYNKNYGLHSIIWVQPTANAAAGVSWNGLVGEALTVSGETKSIDQFAAIYGYGEHRANANITSAHAGLFDFVNTGPGTVTTARAINALLRNTSTGTFGASVGIQSQVTNSSTGSYSDVRGVQASINNSGGGTIPLWYGFRSVITNSNASSKITSAYGYYTHPVTQSGGASIDNLYGLYLSDWSSYSANAYNLYSAGATARHYIQGTLQVDGTTSLGTTTVGGNALIVPKKYVALLSQTGTSAPVATVLENSLGGTLVWSYVDVGKYRVTLTGAFPTASKVFLYIEQWKDVRNGITWGYSLQRIDANTIELNVGNGDEGINGGDFGLITLSNTSMEIRVYP